MAGAPVPAGYFFRPPDRSFAQVSYTGINGSYRYFFTRFMTAIHAEKEHVCPRRSAVLMACLMIMAGGAPSHASGPGGGAPERDLAGTWVSEPALGQLGMIQSTITFQAGGAYAQKLDFISFCDGRDRGIDCEYFWMINEGSWSAEGQVVAIHIEREKKVLLPTGQAEPDITESSEYPHSYEILVERRGDELLIRKSADAEATVFTRER